MQIGDPGIEQRSVTYKVLMGIFVVIVLGLVGVIYSSVDKRVSNVEADVKLKVDTVRHDKDMDEIKGYMRDIRQMLHDHEEKSAKRAMP